MKPGTKLICAALLLLSACAWFKDKPKPPPPKPASVKRELTDQEKIAIEKAVKARIREPGSALFRWEPYVEAESIYCGYVNSGNGTGGFTGYVPFAVYVTFAPKVIGIATPQSGDKANAVLIKNCVDHGYIVY